MPRKFTAFVPRYRKFESISLQRGVRCELDPTSCEPAYASRSPSTAETTPVQPGPRRRRSANAGGNQFPCGTFSDHWWARQSTFAETHGNDWEGPIAA